MFFKNEWLLLHDCFLHDVAKGWKNKIRPYQRSVIKLLAFNKMTDFSVYESWWLKLYAVSVLCRTRYPGSGFPVSQ